MPNTTLSFADHPDFDQHEMVVYCADKSSGLRAFIAIHDSTLGAGMGGCRMKQYADEGEALSDALRLSRGMTFKYAAAGLNHGGAKAVILDDGDHARRDARLLAFGKFVERLGGQYTTAEDAGIDTADVRLMSTVTGHVRNLPLDETGDGALSTAWGVFHGIQAALSFEERGAGLQGRVVAVEGLGKVGMALCSILHEQGAGLIVYDPDEQKMLQARDLYGAVLAERGEIHAAKADIYAPCALGGVLNPKTTPEVRARIIAGAANNQLSDPDQDRALWERGIVYCPDYIVNAGGVLSVAERGAIYQRATALNRVERILHTTRDVLAIARAEAIPTGAAADRLARRRLAA